MKELPPDEYQSYLPPPGYSLQHFSDEKEVHLRDYWRVIRKRQWMILAFVLIAVSITAVKILTTRPVYRGTATIQINIESPQIMDFREIFTVNSWSMDYYQTQHKILESRNLARRVIQSQKLAEHPDFLPQAPTPFEKWKTEALQRAVGLFKGLRFFASSDKNRSPAKDRTEEERDTPHISAFLGRLAIEPVKDSRIVKIHYTSWDPLLASRVPNAVAASFIQLNLESRFNTSEKAKEWLSKQLEEMKAKVERSDEALQEFGSKYGILSGLDDKENVTMKRLNELNEALTKAESERMAKEAIYKQMKQGNGQGFDTLPSIRENKLIQDLKQTYIQLEAQYMQTVRDLQTELSGNDPAEEPDGGGSETPQLQKSTRSWRA